MRGSTLLSSSQEEELEQITGKRKLAQIMLRASTR